MSFQAGPATKSKGGTAAPALIAHIGPADLEAQLRRDALEGLTAPAKSIPSKWFYDYNGSMLFDEITRLPEYYPTRDVLKMAAAELLERYPGLEVQGIVGDFERHLDSIAVPGRSLVIFLGSTIGNLNVEQRSSLLAQLSASLKPGDSFLLGVDLVKDVDTLEAAYNDSAGISAAFNLNILKVLNARLGADFEVESFDHVASFNPETEQMEMFLRATRPQKVRLELLNLDISFEEGELLHTEISAKFRREGIEAELVEAGLQPAQWWTDADHRFAVTLSRKD
jgi:L-histidine N-alpha-methyltransferase